MPPFSRRLGWFWHLPAVLLLWCGGCRLSEGGSTWPLQRYLHAAWWQRGKPPALATVIAQPPGRADGRAWSGYGQALLSAAHQARDPEARGRLLSLSDRATWRAVRLSPAMASTWARLSLIALNRDDRALAVKALRLSLALAPNGINLAWPRAKIGLFLWSDLDDAARRGIANDIRRLSRQPPTVDLPYPVAALRRFAGDIGRGALMETLLGNAVAHAD